MHFVDTPPNASRFGVIPAQISAWKQPPLDGLTDILTGLRDKAAPEKTHEKKIKGLHAEIGQLTVERDFWAEAFRRKARRAGEGRDGPRRPPEGSTVRNRAACARHQSPIVVQAVTPQNGLCLKNSKKLFTPSTIGEHFFYIENLYFGQKPNLIPGNFRAYTLDQNFFSVVFRHFFLIKSGQTPLALFILKNRKMVGRFAPEKKVALNLTIYFFGWWNSFTGEGILNPGTGGDFHKKENKKKKKERTFFVHERLSSVGQAEPREKGSAPERSHGPDTLVFPSLLPGKGNRYFQAPGSTKILP